MNLTGKILKWLNANLRNKQSNDFIDEQILLQNCKFKKPYQPIKIKEIFSNISVSIPREYEQFLTLTNGGVLFVDEQYGQWGLRLYGAETIQVKNQEWFTSYRAKEFLFGDLIIGEFLGDSDLVILRCDDSQPDYGNIIISLPMDTRADWFYLNDFYEFISIFIQSEGEKFWELTLST